MSQISAYSSNIYMIKCLHIWIYMEHLFIRNQSQQSYLYVFQVTLLKYFSKNIAILIESQELGTKGQ